VTVVHASPHAYPEPVNLTFMQSLPPDVTVLDADNGEHGVGASFLFTFANDDGHHLEACRLHHAAIDCDD